MYQTDPRDVGETQLLSIFLGSLQLTKSLTSGSHVFDQEIAFSLLEVLFQIF